MGRLARARKARKQKARLPKERTKARRRASAPKMAKAPGKGLTKGRASGKKGKTSEKGSKGAKSGACHARARRAISLENAGKESTRSRSSQILEEQAHLLLATSVKMVRIADALRPRHWMFLI